MSGGLTLLGVEEAFEKEAVGQGVQVGDLQGIGHQAAGRGAPAGPHGNLALPGEIDDVGHHQEVAGKPHLHQDVDLVFQALPVVRLRGPGMGGGGRQALLQPFPGQPGHEGLHALPLGGGVDREMIGAQLQGDIAAGRDLPRGRQHLGIGEDPGHLLRALEIELVRLELHAARGVHGLAGLDAQQDVVGPGVFGLQVVHVVGGHHGQTPAGAEFQQGLVDLELLRQVVGLDLQVKPPRKDLGVLPGAGLRRPGVVVEEVPGHFAVEAGGQGDEAPVQLLQAAPCPPGGGNRTLPGGPG